MKKVFLLFVAIIGFAVLSNNLSAQTKPTTGKSVVKTEQTKPTSGNAVDKNKSVACDKHDSKMKDSKASSEKKMIKPDVMVKLNVAEHAPDMKKQQQKVVNTK